MNVFILYWHPEPRSFNHAMFTVAKRSLKEAGHDIKTSDLYQMRFDPISSRDNFSTVSDPNYLKLQLEEAYASENEGFFDLIEREIEKMEWCDLMIWQFPLWWFGLPAAIKGWVDRVFVAGRVYGHEYMYEKGRFRDTRAMLSFTTGGPDHAYQDGGSQGDIQSIIKPIHRGILEFVGYGVLNPHVVFAPVRKTDEERQAELDSYAARLKAISKEKTLLVGSF